MKICVVNGTELQCASKLRCTYMCCLRMRLRDDGWVEERDDAEEC